VLLIVFLLQNTETTQVQFLFLDQGMSRALLILISALIGFVLGLLGPRIISHSREKRREQRQQQRAAEEAAPKSEAE
jgi:uncharacterized integral membrane protein